jgi:hypothetical protein
MSSRNRELTRQYKQSGPTVGVYAIRNVVNRRLFVGASLNVEGALNRTRFELGLKSHANKALLADWLQFGSENFRFEVVDTVKKQDDPAFDPRDELESLLAMWREELDCDGDCSYHTTDAIRVVAGLQAPEGATIKLCRPLTLTTRISKAMTMLR